MAEAGKIYHNITRIEIDEQGHIWLVQNNFETDSIISDLEAVSHGYVIIEDDWIFEEDDEDYF